MARNPNPTDGFGAALRMHRRALRLTLAQLAELTGLTGSYLSRLENNAVAVPPVETLMRIADALEVDVSALTQAAGRMPMWVLRAYDETPEAFHTLAKMSPKDRRAFARSHPTPTRSSASKRGKDPERPLSSEEVKRLVRKLKY